MGSILLTSASCQRELLSELIDIVCSLTRVTSRISGAKQFAFGDSTDLRSVWSDADCSGGRLEGKLQLPKNSLGQTSSSDPPLPPALWPPWPGAGLIVIIITVVIIIIVVIIILVIIIPVITKIIIISKNLNI